MLINLGLGRLTESDQYESGSSYISTTQHYDALGRVYQTFNPLRPGDASWGTKYATDHFYDALGRPTQVMTEVGGASAFTSYAGNSVISTDQAGKQHKTTSDALGRLERVVEDPNGLNYTTVYSYDALDDLTCINQAAASTNTLCSTTATGTQALTRDETILIASTFFKLFSTNKDRSGPMGMDPEAYHFTVLGYDAGAAYGK